MKYRKTPEGQVVGFPDDMSDNEILDVFKKKYPSPSPLGVFNVSKSPEGMEKLKDFFSNPRNLKQMGEGAAQGILNLPADIGNLGINASNAIYSTKVPNIPGFNFAPKTEAAGAGEFLSNIVPMGVGGLRSIPSIAEKLPSTLPGASLGSVFKNMFKNLNPKQWIKKMQEAHDLSQTEAKNLYNHVKEETKVRGINKVNIDKDTNNLINSIHKDMVQSDANKSLIEKAKTGDYESLHKLQSDAGKRSEKLKSSDYVAENDKGELLNEKRDKLIGKFIDHFTKTGNLDLAEKWQQARELYRKIHEIYYPKKKPAIGKIFERDLREVPSNPMALLGKDSVPVNSLLEHHPEIKNLVDIYKERQQGLNLLKNLGLGTAITGFGLEGAEKGISALKHLFGRNK